PHACTLVPYTTLFRSVLGLVLGLAQDTHDALAQLVEYVMGVAVVVLTAGCVMAGTAGEFADQLLQADVGVLHQGLHGVDRFQARSEEHTSELQSRSQI